MTATANVTKVRFDSAQSGVILAGDLYTPPQAQLNGAAFVIIGPMTYQKEQAPTEYARRLAELGHTALAFDTRYRGACRLDVRLPDRTNPKKRGDYASLQKPGHEAAWW